MNQTYFANLYALEIFDPAQVRIVSGSSCGLPLGSFEGKAFSVEGANTGSNGELWQAPPSPLFEVISGFPEVGKQLLFNLGGDLSGNVSVSLEAFNAPAAGPPGDEFREASIDLGCIGGDLVTHVIIPAAFVVRVGNPSDAQDGFALQGCSTPVRIQQVYSVSWQPDQIGSAETSPFRFSGDDSVFNYDWLTYRPDYRRMTSSELVNAAAELGLIRADETVQEDDMERLQALLESCSLRLIGPKLSTGEVDPLFEFLFRQGGNFSAGLTPFIGGQLELMRARNVIQADFPVLLGAVEEGKVLLPVFLRVAVWSSPL